MKKLSILCLLCFLLLSGCENKEEKAKASYMEAKSKLIEEKKWIKEQELPLNIEIDIKRLDEERVKYKIIFSDPKEDMNKIKIMAVHNYYSEALYPSIGIFNKETSLLKGNDNQIILEDSLKTTKNIDDLNLKFKIWIQYLNNQNEEKEIYYIL